MIKQLSQNLRQFKKEGQREVERQIEFYNLDVIISVGYHVKSKRGFICGWGKENRRRCFSGADNYDCGIQTGGKGNDDQCDYELHAIRGKSENIAPNDTYLFTTGSK